MLRPMSVFSKNWLLSFSCALVAGCTHSHAAALTDIFADRQTLTDASGVVSGDNLNATSEANEPAHGGKLPSHSMWISWIAPSDGIVTFDTGDSSFDTTLAAYTLDANTKPPMERLRVSSQNDNATRDVTTSLIQFGVSAGVEYQIAVDGANGATGNIQLAYNFVASSDPPAIILSVPPDHSLQFGDTLTLTVAFQTSKSVHLAWFFNDVEILNSDTPTLVIPNFQQANVGLYKLRITAGNVRMFTNPIEIQINSEGLTATLARNHLFDALNSKLDDHGQDPGKAAPRKLSAMAIGVTRGYNGSQVFNTTFADLDPNEPAPCGVTGGASYWLAYVTPASGVAHIDTAGSDFDTVLAVYTHIGPLTGYQDLIPVDCDDNSGPDGRTSRLTFNANGGQEYLIVVDGIGGAHGIAYLNYHLEAAPAGVPPVIAQQPFSQQIAAGTAVTLSVAASGTSPLSYAWSFQSNPLAGQTAANLALFNVQLDQAGDYYVVVSNAFGSIKSAVASLSVVGLPSVGELPQTVSTFAGETLTLSPIVTGLAVQSVQWQKDGVAITSQTNQQLTIFNVTAGDGGTYVLFVSNLAGTVQSAPVVVSVLAADPPVITSQPQSKSVKLGDSATFEVVATGPAPLNFSWKFQNTLMSGQAGPTLTLPNVSTANAGEYIVEVSNLFGTASSVPVTLSILVPPSIAAVPVLSPKLLGSSLSIALDVIGSAPFTFAWKKSGVALPGQASAPLYIPKLNLEDSGDYQLEVSNAAGTATSDPISVQVISPSIAIEAISEGIVLQLPVETNMHYHIEANDSLGNGLWNSVQEGIGSSSGMISVTNSLRSEQRHVLPRCLSLMGLQKFNRSDVTKVRVRGNSGCKFSGFNR